jgi:hypothetical protein
VDAGTVLMNRTLKWVKITHIIFKPVWEQMLVNFTTMTGSSDMPLAVVVLISVRSL